MRESSACAPSLAETQRLEARALRRVDRCDVRFRDRRSLHAPIQHEGLGVPAGGDQLYGWIGERVAVTDLDLLALEHLILEKDDVSSGPNAKFRFPKEGGTGRIWERMADLAGRERIMLGNGVAKFSLEKKIAVLADGTEISFERCLSTMPLDSFIGLTEETGNTERELAAKLKFSSSNIVGIGIEGRPPPALATKAWMYFPEGDCPFYRVTVFSNYSPKNVPDAGTEWSLISGSFRVRREARESRDLDRRRRSRTQEHEAARRRKSREPVELPRAARVSDTTPRSR